MNNCSNSFIIKIKTVIIIFVISVPALDIRASSQGSPLGSEQVPSPPLSCCAGPVKNEPSQVGFETSKLGFLS